MNLIPGRDGIDAGMSPVLLLGGTGQVGRFLLPRLLDDGAPVIAVSRKVPGFSRHGLTWLQQDLMREAAHVQAQVMLSAGPLKLALRQAERMPGLRRLVALSSASVMFKRRSPDLDERRVIESLIDAERQLDALAEKRGIDLTILRPTLIYGVPALSALRTISGWLEHRRWVPVAGDGLRQPVHADDLAGLMKSLAATDQPGRRILALGGGETLPYSTLVRRIGASMGIDVRVYRIPSWVIKPALRMAHGVGRFTTVGPAMISRQRMDLVVDDTEAREQLGWNPRPFRP